MKVLYLCFIWPEPKSSAAGFRTLQQLISLKNANYQVIAASSCQQNQYQKNLEEIGIKTYRFLPNDPTIDEFLSEWNPDIVIFDRFMIEEQFSWRVKQICPNALRVLDTIDLHSLRRARQNDLINDKKNSDTENDFSDDLIREVASIYRSDISFLVSDFEYKYLTENLDVDNTLLNISRFYYPDLKSTPKYSERKNFVSIGNFNHPPNVDSVKLLSHIIWPKIRSLLVNTSNQDAQLHIYGAYPTEEIKKLDDPKNNFIVKGWAEEATQTLSEYKVNLAPLRFGAGIKGKVSDGWYAGTPCVGTSIAAEGMCEQHKFGGIIEDDFEKFAACAVNLYSDSDFWLEAQTNGFELIQKLYNAEKNSKKFLSAIQQAYENKQHIRSKNLIGAVLWSSQMRSTQYLSRWIELKNNQKITNREN